MTESRRERRKQETRPRRMRRWWIITLTSIAVIAVSLVAFRLGTQPSIDTSDYSGPGKGEAQVVIAVGDSTSIVGDKLVAAEVVASRGAFVNTCREKKVTQIEPGTYQLHQKMASGEALNMLLEAKTKAGKVITVQDGATVEETLTAISAITGISLSDLQKAAKDTKGIGLPNEAQGKLEGWLAPGSHTYTESDSAKAILSRMVAARVKELKSLSVPNNQWQSVLIKASIAEKEARTDEDRSKIATVINNRLKAGKPLEIQSVLAYGVKKKPLDLTQDDFTNTKTPYNVFIELGLPPSPINNPSLRSVKDVVYPIAGPWMKWVMVNLDSGKVRFSTTQTEYAKDYEEYQEWMKKNMS